MSLESSRLSFNFPFEKLTACIGEPTNASITIMKRQIYVMPTYQQCGRRNHHWQSSDVHVIKTTRRHRIIQHLHHQLAANISDPKCMEHEHFSWTFQSCQQRLQEKLNNKRCGLSWSECHYKDTKKWQQNGRQYHHHAHSNEFCRSWHRTQNILLLVTWCINKPESCQWKMQVPQGRTPKGGNMDGYDGWMLWFPHWKEQKESNIGNHELTTRGA